MAGKMILGVLAFLLLLILLLVLLLQIPVKVRFTYDQGDLALEVQFGFLKLQLFPRPEKSEKPEEEKKKRPKKKKEKKEKKKKPKAKINREQIFFALEELPPILGCAMRRTGKSFRINPLKIWLLVAGNDPSDTAILYGRLEAALTAGFPVLRNTVSVKEEDIRLYLDFTEAQIDCIADVGVALRPWRLVTIGIRTLASLFKWYRGFRKLASPLPPEEPETKQKDESRSDGAA